MIMGPSREEVVSSRAEIPQPRARATSIRGLAKSIAKPAYRRLLAAEPALRRIVPLLLIAFLVSSALGVALLIFDRYRTAIATASANLETVADRFVDRIGQPTKDDLADRNRIRVLFMRALPPSSTAPERLVFLTNQAGTVIAAAPIEKAAIGLPMTEIIRSTNAPALTPGTSDVLLSDGSEGLASVRTLDPPLGRIIAVQSRAAALTAWHADTAMTITLFVAASFVLLLLGFAFHWQAKLAREADLIYDTVRRRIDVALNCGRCGLWDWDLSKEQIFWSESMFNILGMHPNDDVMTIDEVSSFTHPADIDLHELAAQLGGATGSSVDRVFRMRHAVRGWVQLRVRWELLTESDGTGPHLIGIALETADQTGESQASRYLQSVPNQELYKNLRENGNISQGARLPIKTGVNAFPMVTFSKGLVRSFSTAVYLAAIGLACLIFGLIIGKFSITLLGSATLSVGLIGMSVTVLHGESIIHDRGISTQRPQ
jgi:two-component system cell cycle sensor histidine kinase PleC